MEDEPVADQQTADRASILSREKLGSAQENKEAPQSKVSLASEEETKVAQSPAVEKQETAEPKQSEAMQDQNMRSTTMQKMDEAYEADKGAHLTFTFNDGLVV